MKRLLIALMAIAFVAATAPTVWAQSGSNVKSDSNKPDTSKPDTNKPTVGKEKTQVKKPSIKLPQ